MRHFDKFFVCTTIPGAGAAVVGAAVVGADGAVVVGASVVGTAVVGWGVVVVGETVVGGNVVPETNGMKNLFNRYQKGYLVLESAGTLTKFNIAAYL